jgi:hypothetical protein
MVISSSSVFSAKESAVVSHFLFLLLLTVLAYSVESINTPGIPFQARLLLV